MKNNPTDARAKYDKTSFAESASTGEASAYYFGRQLLSMHGIKVQADGPLVEYGGIPTMTGSKVVLAPRFGTTGAEIRSKFPSPGERQHLAHVEPCARWCKHFCELTDA